MSNRVIITVLRTLPHVLYHHSLTNICALHCVYQISSLKVVHRYTLEGKLGYDLVYTGSYRGLG
jgi:hypothetical protein